MTEPNLYLWTSWRIPIGFLPWRIVARASAMVLAGALTACSGGGGGDESDFVDGAVTIGGSFNASDAFPNARVLPGVNVCALGSCDLTDDLGQWAFTVPESSYDGGSVQFSFNGSGVDTTTIVGNLSPNSRSVAIDFTVISDGSVVADEVNQDGTPVPVPLLSPVTTVTSTWVHCRRTRRNERVPFLIDQIFRFRITFQWCVLRRVLHAQSISMISLWLEIPNRSLTNTK